MPLAISASLLMLLGSLSVQSAVLQSRLGQSDRETLAAQEDAAVSAAQQLVGALDQRHPCLLPLSLQAWAVQGRECATAADLGALARGRQGDMGWQLLSWRPGLSAVELLIELQPAAGGTARRAAFSVALLPDPPRVRSLRPLGWRGVTP